MNKKIAKSKKALAPRRIDNSLTIGQEIEAATLGITEFILGIASTVVPAIGVYTAIRDQREAMKKEKVVEALRQMHGRHEFQIAQISNLLRSPKGMILFNKILYLSRASELEEDDFSNFTALLAQIISNISGKNFEDLFDKMSYAISRIEQLSPQALFLLGDSANWPRDSVGGTTMSGYTLSGDGLKIVATGYLRDKGNTDAALKPRLQHAFGELQSGGYMNFSENKRAVRTEVAQEIYELLFK